jgi:hypothetical protein
MSGQSIEVLTCFFIVTLLPDTGLPFLLLLIEIQSNLSQYGTTCLARRPLHAQVGYYMRCCKEPLGARLGTERASASERPSSRALVDHRSCFFSFLSILCPLSPPRV